MPKKTKNLNAFLRASIHSVERAFSLKNTRKPFGIELVQRLNDLKSYTNNGNYSFELTQYNRAIRDYKIFHDQKHSLNNDFLKSTKEYKHKNREGYLSVVNSRHSIRNFGDNLINEKDIFKALVIAKNNTPSVCNRQSWSIDIISNQSLVKKVLDLQNGNKGIEGIQQVLVVKVDLEYFFGTEERKQPFIDGGIFLMSILNSLHFKNIASCALNWSVKNNRDKELKDLLEINPSQDIICLVGLGSYPKSEIKVAASRKRNLKNIIRVFK